MITLVGMFRNEAKYIKEWLCYYHLIGIDSFIVFLHKNTDCSLHVLDSLSFKEKIQTVGIEEENDIGVHFQNRIYERAIELAKTEWIIYLDIDEFLFLPNHPNIGKFLSDIPDDVGGLAIYQNIFGSCGHAKSPDGLVIENYTTRNEDDIELDKRTTFLFLKPCGLFAEVKILLRKNDISYIKTIHEVFSSKKIVIEDGSVFQKQKIKRSTSNIKINHYFTKSKEDWISKTGRQRISGSSKYNEDFFEYFEAQTHFDDMISQKYAEKIKSL
jgi:hypothetical protein